MLDEKTIRKLLMTAVVVALAATPATAEVPAECWDTPKHGGLFCNDGSEMEVCRDRGGNCAVSCGKKWVPVEPCERPLE